MQWSSVVMPTRGNGRQATVVRDGITVSYIGEKNRWAKYRVEGAVAYDLDLSSPWSPVTDTMGLVGYGESGLAHLLAHSYPYAPLYGNAEVDRFITQAAIWWYLSDLGINTLSEDLKSTSPDPYGLRPHIRRLVDAAMAARSSGLANVYAIGETPLAACVLADNGGGPHAVTLARPNDLALEPLSAQGAISLADEVVDFSSIALARPTDVVETKSLGDEKGGYEVSHTASGVRYILLGGAGRSYGELMGLVNELIRSGELPVNAPYSVRILPTPPTSEMLREPSVFGVWDTRGQTAHASWDGASPSGGGVQHAPRTAPSPAPDPGLSNGPHYVFRAGRRLGD
ncbi:thioester domain-containing protein [Thermophilibacter provencensis]|uniref:thioester domain-containing protein n=1 Tax=Thermophilibacter provencensis TaxID=1852386 RepID=UPI002356D004|nr:thioester domain-containing protein [Thermophilibacter provencensis]